MLPSLVIDEKRVEKSSTTFCRPNGLCKAIFTFTSESDKFTSIDAEGQREVYQIVCMCVTCSVLDLLTKHVSKNHRTNFASAKAVFAVGSEFDQIC